MNRSYEESARRFPARETISLIAVVLAFATPASAEPPADTNYPAVEFFSIHEHGGEPPFGEPDQNPNAWVVLDSHRLLWPESSWNILGMAYIGGYFDGLAVWDPSLTGELQPAIDWYFADNIRVKNAIDAKVALDPTLGPADVPGGVSWFGSVASSWDAPFDENWLAEYKTEVDQLFADGALGIKDHPTFRIVAGFNMANGYCDPVATGTTGCTNPCPAGEYCKRNGYCSEDGGKPGDTTPCTIDRAVCSDPEETCHGEGSSTYCDFEGFSNVAVACLQQSTVRYPLLEDEMRDALRYITHDKAKPVIIHPHTYNGPYGDSKCHDPIHGGQVDCSWVFRKVFFDFIDHVSNDWTEEGRRRFIMAHGFTYLDDYEVVLDAGLSVDMNTKPENHQQWADCDDDPLCGCYTREFFRKPEWADNIMIGMTDGLLWEDGDVSWTQRVTEDLLFQAFEPISSIQNIRGVDVAGADLGEPDSVAAGCCSIVDTECQARFDIPPGIRERYLVGNADEILTPTQRIFVTNWHARGDLDFFNGAPAGIESANEECRWEAEYYGLPGTWVAMVSTDQTDVRDLVDADNMSIFTEGGTTYKNMNDEIVAIGATDLFGSYLDAQLNYLADGEQLPAWARVWTGSLDDGTAYDDKCNDWSSNDPAPTYGTSGGTDYIGGWLGAFLVPCNAWQRIYCVEAPVR